MKDPLLYIGHMLECISKIETYTLGGRGQFLTDSLIQDAVLRNLEIIGEAASNIALEFRQSHPNVEWRRAIALRNVLIHNYAGIRIERVWTDVTSTLPNLKAHSSSCNHNFQ
jgi:uncharacterized protein with HEPN domain